MSAGRGPGEGVTQVLRRLEDGHPGAFADLVNAVYEDMRAIAHGRMRWEFGPRKDQISLQATDLANRVLMEIQNQRQIAANTEQFFAIAARLLMRRLTDYQRARLALKRGSGSRGEALEEGAHTGAAGRGGGRGGAGDDSGSGPGDALLAAMELLHEANARQAEVVTLHVWAGQPLPRVAEMLGVSLPTVERDWRFAKAFLKDRVGDEVG